MKSELKALLYLTKPHSKYNNEIVRFRSAVFALQNDEYAFSGCCGLYDYEDPNNWIAHTVEMQQPETCPAQFTCADTYLAVRSEDEKLVGIINLRHDLKHPMLKLRGGHIGYSICPTEQGKGYGKEMLRLALPHCKALGLDKVLVTCNINNPASEGVIRANGGVFENTVQIEEEQIKRFWIDL